MTDREKVIKGLEEAHDVIEKHVPVRYWGYSTFACTDAIALLKAQEPVPPESENWWKHTYGRCGGCRVPLPSIEGLKSKFCWMCGRPVKWDD